jgi:hypothetical protein
VTVCGEQTPERKALARQLTLTGVIVNPDAALAETDGGDQRLAIGWASNPGKFWRDIGDGIYRNG